MKKGHLSEYFTGVAVKRLAAVEADLFRSNQHEFDGVAELKQLFGTQRRKFDSKFIYLSDNDDEPLIEDGFLTWYDARDRHPTRSEFRLYFPSTRVSQAAAEGDLLVIGRRPDGSVLVVVAEAGSTIANQVRWLFGVVDLMHPGYSVREELESEQDRIAFASRIILETIGVTVEAVADTRLDEMLRRFEGVFPSTWEFSEYARSTVPEADWRTDPDAALMVWMEREEILFRTLERHMIADRLSGGFTDDVDGFISFSLSVQNRRKSRVGLALENHLEHLFRSGSGNLNSVLGGNSVHDAGRGRLATGVFDGKEISAAHPPHAHAGVQGASGPGGATGRQDFGGVGQAFRGAPQPDHRVAQAVA